MTDAPTDALGNVTPAGMVAAQSPQVLPNALPQEGQDDAQPQAPAPGSFAQKLGSAADSIGILPGVGGWAKSLVAATVNSLPRQQGDQGQSTSAPTPSSPGGWRGAVGKIASAAEGIGRSLGDAA